MLFDAREAALEDFWIFVLSNNQDCVFFAECCSVGFILASTRHAEPPTQGDHEEYHPSDPPPIPVDYFHTLYKTSHCHRLLFI